MMTTIASSWSSVLDEPPSCACFCPSNPAILVVGTYLLHGTAKDSQADDDLSVESAADARQSAAQKRTGKLKLFKLEGVQVTHLQSVELGSAVLDIEWSPHRSAHGELLCVATSTGSLEFYTLQSHTLNHISSFQISDPSILVLDLVWHPQLADTIGITLSSGDVALCRSTTSSWTTGAQINTETILSHTLEPWTLAFIDDGTYIFSGGDDATLQCSDISNPSSPQQKWQDRKLHSAGVTAISPLKHDLLVTGSYDDHIRLISAPALGRRKVLAELNLGGGVWRIKKLPWGGRHVKEAMQDSAAQDEHHGSAAYTGQAYNRFVFLASCMHVGSRIVQLVRHDRRLPERDEGDGESVSGEAEWQFELLAKFEEHKSMNYGSDVQPSGGSDKTIVSTSFYDHLMCAWKFDMDTIV